MVDLLRSRSVAEVVGEGDSSTHSDSRTNAARTNSHAGDCTPGEPRYLEIASPLAGYRIRPSCPIPTEAGAHHESHLPTEVHRKIWKFSAIWAREDFVGLDGVKTYDDSALQARYPSPPFPPFETVGLAECPARSRQRSHLIGNRPLSRVDLTGCHMT